MPTAVLVLWVLTLAGWATVGAGLRRGLSGYARRLATAAHVGTLPGLILLHTTLGFGSLHCAIAAFAQWWALALVTGFRPERLLVSGGPGRAAAWAAATAALALAATRLIF
ncbi:hypothetical protein [Spirillospora sp. CA-294931]|uniref:hypothetical protein n=1 Tax=Spirillospora sp. CA-294931 TaxID=3240042 RepID=UPI003D8B5D29